MIIDEISEFISLLNPNKPILGIDFGRKKLGTALVYLTTKTPVPLINCTQGQIQNIILKYKPHAVVMGIPFGELENDIKNFACSISIPVFLQEERYSSKIAQHRLREINIKRKIRDAVDDKISASIILEFFLENLKNTSQ